MKALRIVDLRSKLYPVLERLYPVSLISRLRSVVAGDDYLDNEFDDLDYEQSDEFDPPDRATRSIGSELAPFSQSMPFDLGSSSSNSNVIGMPLSLIHI